MIGFLKLALGVDTHLVDLREQEERQESTEDAKCAGDEERILALANVVGSILLDDWQNVGAHESANLANGGSIRVVLTTDSSSATLGGTQAKVITRAKLAQREEDAITSQKRQNRDFLQVKRNIPVDHHEATHVLRGRKPLVAPGHDEPNNTLKKHTDGKSVTRTNPVTHPSAESGTRQVKHVSQGSPAKVLPQRCIGASDDPDPLRGIQAEGVGRKVVDEPDQRDHRQAEPVKP